MSVTIDSIDMSLSKHWKTMEDGAALCAAMHEITKSQTRFSGMQLSSCDLLALEHAGFSSCGTRAQ